MRTPQPARSHLGPRRAVRLASAAVAALSFALATTRAGAQSPAAGDAMHFEGLGSFGGAVTGIVADGTRAFVSRGERIDTFDVTEPGAPRFIATSEPLGGVATVVGAGGGRLLATVRSSVDGDVQERLVVFATDGARPEATGDLGVEVRGDRWVKAVEAAVTDGRTAFVAPGITDEAPPSRALQLRDLRALPRVAAAAFEMPSPVSDLALDGRWLYAATADGLTVLDVGDPLAPVAAGTLALPYARSIALHGAQALVAAAGGIHRVDIADPSAPAVVDRFAALSGAEVVVAGRDAWVATFGGLYTGLMATLTHFDADQPGMRVVGYGVHDLRGMVAVGDRLLTAEGRTGFSSLAMVDGRDPYVEPRWHADVLGDVAGLAQEAGLAYAADGDSELWVLDPADPASPRPVGRVDAPGEAFAPPKVSLGGLAVRDRMAYVSYLSGTDTGGGGVAIVDVGDAQAPVVLSAWANYDVPEAEEQAVRSYEGPTNVFGPTLRGFTLFLPGQTVPLTTLDVAHPDAPRWRGRFGGPEPYYSAGGLALDGARGWLALNTAPGQGVGVLDIDADERPTLVDRIPLAGWTNDVAVAGAHVIAAVQASDDDAATGGRLWIIDTATRRPVASVEDVPGGRLTLDGARAYLTDGRALAVVDLADPTAPRVLARLPLLGIRDDDGAVVRRVGDRLWVADGDVGIRIVRLAEGAEGEERGGTVYLPWAGR